jgi:hypothetical protein
MGFSENGVRKVQRFIIMFATTKGHVYPFLAYFQTHPNHIKLIYPIIVG